MVKYLKLLIQVNSGQGILLSVRYSDRSLDAPGCLLYLSVGSGDLWDDQDRFDGVKCICW